MAQYIEVGRLEGARRHLETGIELFFERKDPVVVYSVAWSAYGVLSDMCHARGIKRDFEDAEFFDQLDKKRKKEIFDAVKRPRNFFQHGGERGKETLQFHPRNAPIFLLMAHTLYIRLGQEPLRAGQVLTLWFAAMHSERVPVLTQLFGATIRHIPRDDYDLFLSIIRGTPPKPDT